MGFVGEAAAGTSAARYLAGDIQSDKHTRLLRGF